jgi:hypothetical protein
VRTITDHKLNGLNDAIAITADAPGSGGASHEYKMVLNISDDESLIFSALLFQNGPISKPADMNGITNEALLAVLIDRMRGFQSGQFACRENAIALTHLEEALMWLQKRTRDRLARGVEGTHIK